MRLFLALIVCFFAFSQCEEDIQDNKRTVVTGKLSDRNGQPLVGVEVISRASELTLGMGSSDETGSFEFISLVPSRPNFSIEINPNLNISDFSRLKLNFMDQEIRRDYDLGELILNKNAVLNLNINKITDDNNFLSYSVEFRIDECNIFDDPNVQINLENCSETSFFSDATTINNPDSQIEISSILNSIAIFTYRIGDGERQTIEITLNDSNTIFDFEY